VKKWILIVAGALVSLVLLVVLVGSLLPVSHVASRAAEFRQSPDTLWRAITDVAAYPRWRSGIAGVQVLAEVDGHQRWVEDEGRQRVAFEATESDPPRRLVVRIADGNLPFGGSWTYVLTPTDSGTRLGITENGEVYNPLFRFLSRFVFGHTATIDGYLQSLGTRFGERVTPVEG
jgi:hypothetical protein